MMEVITHSSEQNYQTNEDDCCKHLDHSLSLPSTYRLAATPDSWQQEARIHHPFGVVGVPFLFLCIHGCHVGKLIKRLTYVCIHASYQQQNLSESLQLRLNI